MKQAGIQVCMLIIAIGVYLVVSVQAAVIYVDKDNTCPGFGTSESPYCSISHAVKVISAGDSIRIRDAATPYDEHVAVHNGSPSGTATNPIVVESDAGHTPVIRYTGNGAARGAIELQDVDYWTIQRLTFDGTGIYTARHAIMVKAITRDVSGIEVIGNTFKNWGGEAAKAENVATVLFSINDRQAPFLTVKNSLIRGNTFDGNRGKAILIKRTTDVIVEHNEVRNQECGYNKHGVHNSGIQINGINPTYQNVGAIIRYNTVHDFEPIENCAIKDLKDGGHFIAGIWADVSAINGKVYNNTVYNIPKTKASRGIGILIEAKCHNWVVSNNAVYNIAQTGIRNGNKKSEGNNNIYVNNTLLQAGNIGIDVWKGSNIAIKNNIVVGSSERWLNMSDEAVKGGGHYINYNLYEEANIGAWGQASSRLDLQGRRSTGQSDTNSLNASALFVSLTPGNAGFLRLTPSSPARGAGENGVDMGAYPYSNSPY